MVLLSEAIGTKYIINKIDKRLRVTLEGLVGQEVDLNGCRFGPECADILKTFYDKITFRNTESKELDDLLKYNRDLILNPEEEWEVLDFDKVVTKDNWFNDIPKIPTGKYLIKIDRSDIIQECLLILTIMARPDIEYDLSECMADITSIVSKNVDINEFNEDKVFVTKAPYIELVDKSEIDRYSVGVIPACFGRDKMIAFDGSKPKLPAGFEPLLEWINTIMTRSTNANLKEEKVDITEFLQMRD